MAYLHCNSCNWSQDDFWDWSYNPWRWFFCTSIKEWGWPRMIKCDRELNAKRRVFSWQLLWRDFWRMFTRPMAQKYWTNASWKRALQRRKNLGYKPVWPPCPECGQQALDID